MNLKSLLLTLLLVFLPLATAAGEEDDAAWRFSVSTTAGAGIGSHSPFWFTANRHGLVSMEPTSAMIRSTAVRPFAGTRRGFDWECGADVAALTGMGSDRTGVLQQLYGGVRWNCWEITVGSKEHASQGKDQRLTSGGMTWSGNARPIPQVRIGISDYVSLPRTNEWLQVKGFLSYGCLTDNHFQREFASQSRYSTYNQNALFNEKSAFLRIGNGRYTRWSLELGLEMDCMFGGELWEHDARLSSTDTDHLLFDQPETAGDFVKALVPLNGGDESTLSDQRNAAGNHFGSAHASLCYTFGNWKIRGYYEHYFEGRSGMTPWNGTYDLEGNHHVWIAYPWKDKLAGLEVTFPWNPYLNKLVFEYNTTRDQCGSIHHGASPNIPANIYGFGCYYYNSSYPSWQHHGHTAGSPLLYSPLYSESHILTLKHTRIRAFHLGLEGQPSPTLGWRMLATVNRSWGSYFDPLPNPEQTVSMLVEATYAPRQLEGWTGTAAVACDRSALIGNNAGLQVTLKRTF